MKRFSAVFLISVLMMCGVFAQKVETAYTFPIDDEFPVFDYTDKEEGTMTYLSSVTVDGNVFYFQTGIHGHFYKGVHGKRPEVVLEYKGNQYSRPFSSTLGNDYIFGYLTNGENGDETEFICKIDGSLIYFHDIKTLSLEEKMYFTGKILFAEDENTHSLRSIEFLPDGSYTVRNASETDAWLKSGKGEELGWSQKINKRNGKVSSNYFGDIDLSTVTEFYKPSCFDNAHDDEIIGAAFDALWNSRYNNFAKDSKGLIYFRKMDTDDGPFDWGEPAKNIKFDIAILDPWTKQVKYYEDYAPNEWNPPRDANGKIIGSYSWTVAPDGNIYFTDADVEKGEYQIKRVINRWWDDMGINDRIIGQMNTNHIPLLTAMNGSQNDGYCFENDFVWVTEQSKDKKWSKIKKIDGREGWIETKYIDINTMAPVTNASLGITIDQSPATTAAVSAAKILKAADNLRLRKTELTSSEVITTMLKGTPVKIVATGRQETIDGITGNWVQVEVQSGGKDRNGSPIPAGTIGWCFGGYLE